MALVDRQPERDLSPAEWIVESIHDFAVDVGSVVPPLFAAYARVFHPAEKSGRPMPWSELARLGGHRLHPEAQLPHLVGFWHPYERRPAPWDREPEEGSMPPVVASALSEVLAAHTTTPGQCWFGVWEGWGGLLPPWRRTPVFRLPNRAFHLVRGPITEASTSAEPRPMHQTANLWWPDDRAWCVATEIDFSWTYVAGSVDCIAALLSHPGLEALETKASAGVTFDADRVNPPPPGRPF